MSQETTLQDSSGPLRKALSSDSAASSFASIGLTTTKPSTAIPRNGKFLLVVPYGAGAENDTFDMRINGVWRIDNAGTTEYVVQPLAQIAVTLSATTGSALRAITASYRFADTLSSTFGSTSNIIVSPGSDVTGYALIDLKGCEWFVLDFDLGGTTTAANALIGSAQL